MEDFEKGIFLVAQKKNEFEILAQHPIAQKTCPRLSWGLQSQA